MDMMWLTLVTSFLLLSASVGTSLDNDAAAGSTCDQPEYRNNCTACVTLDGCSWYVCQRDKDQTGCGNTTAGPAEGCAPIADATSCEPGPPPENVTTTTPPPTTEFPTTTTPLPDTTTTEPPTTTTPPPTTEPPTTTEPTTPETTTTEPPTTEPTTPEPPTTTAPTTEPPTIVPTTTVPSTGVPPTDQPVPSPDPSPTPAPRTGGGFSFGSFFGGIVFCLVAVGGVFLGLRLYRQRMGTAGRRYNNF